MKTYLLLALIIIAAPVFAQNGSNGVKIFSAEVDAIDSVTLSSAQRMIQLWGVEAIADLPARLKVKARLQLKESIAQTSIECEDKGRAGTNIIAQCVNNNGEDLSLLMLQYGFALADHKALTGSVFEQPYIQAEQGAKDNKIGIWSDGEDNRGNGLSFVIAGFALFVVMIVALGVICVIILRGFQTVNKAQHKNLEMIARERKIRNKERSIIAIMLDAEIKANKSKIEAYLIVYEEMLNALKDSGRQPKYKRAGDIVQQQPALDRSVFDRNTDKLDILGARLSSEVVHFYARIKTKPDYMNLEPETPLEDAIALVEKSVEKVQRLNAVAERLIAKFEEGGMASDDFVMD